MCMCSMGMVTHPSISCYSDAQKNRGASLGVCSSLIISIKIIQICDVHDLCYAINIDELKSRNFVNRNQNLLRCC